ncbi:MAG: AEC family transporter [Clostridiales bacterium]|nr:AEC family transporter [Clostridiales bacterium]
MSGLVIQQTLVLGILMVVGAACAKSGILNKERSQGISGLLINVTLPAMVVQKCLITVTPQQLERFVWAAIYSALYFVLAVAFSQIFIRKTDKYDYRVMRFAIIYQNCGLVGIPFVQGVFGSEMVFYVVPMVVIMNMLCYTHGVLILRKSSETGIGLDFLLSPGVLSIFIGLIFFFTGISLPEIVTRPLGMLADLTTPLAMILGGYTVATTDYKSMEGKGRLLAISAVRLIVIPVLYIMILRFLPGDDKIKLILVLASSCSCSAVSIPMAMKHGRDHVFATNTFALTAVFTMLTVPVIMMLAQMFGLG